MTAAAPPPDATACLLLADGALFFGKAFGADTAAFGEICFNTGMTGYQEVLTDPSYTGQIITFTFPHIGNTGCNGQDIESHKAGASGMVVRELPTPPSSFRAEVSLDDWLIAHNVMGIAGVDTRALTRSIRKHGAQNACIFRVRSSEFGVQLEAMQRMLAAQPSLKGMELCKGVTTSKNIEWEETLWQLNPKLKTPNSKLHHVIAIDFGEKLNILRNLAERGCRITVVPATTTAEEILALKPDGIFLSNGPGDPAATATYAASGIKKLIDASIPMFGICLGHQLLGLAVGARTDKMKQGHRGANHPIKNLETGNVEITSQNHGFVVLTETLPQNAKATHISLFDGTLAGFRLTDKPVFCVQYHPEASPGPHDSQYLFDEFVGMMSSK